MSCRRLRGVWSWSQRERPMSILCIVFRDRFFSSLVVNTDQNDHAMVPSIPIAIYVAMCMRVAGL